MHALLCGYFNAHCNGPHQNPCTVSGMLIGVFDIGDTNYYLESLLSHLKYGWKRGIPGSDFCSTAKTNTSNQW